MVLDLRAALSLTAITLICCAHCHALPAHQAKIKASTSLAKEQLVYQKLARVDNLMAINRFVEARLLLLDLLQYHPNCYSTEVESLLAESCYRLGNAKEAMVHYRAAIKYDAKNWRLYWNAALCSMNMGQYKVAIDYANKVLSNNPPGNIKAEASQFVLDMQEKISQPQNAVNTLSDDYIDSLLASQNANRWAMDKMPLKVYIQPLESPKTNNHNLVIDALNTWAKASKGKLSFTLTPKPLLADLTIGFTKNTSDIQTKPGVAPVELGLTRFNLVKESYQPADRPNLTGQLQAINNPYGKIDRAEVIILLLKPVSQEALNADEIKEITLHEIGHALGLAGHSENSSDIMYFNQSFSQLPALTKRDKASIARLYQDYPLLEQSGVLGYQYQPLKLPQRNTP